ncbi:MAG: YjbH domain-containing protein [Nitrospirae bacterium]|nr:YjbH domain-containing protein [Nitrospirota bacterium]
MEVPTARVMRKNSYRLGISQVTPYRYYYGAISPLKGLEITGRITEVLGVDVINPTFQGYGDYKDKAVDLKYQFIPEGKYLPAVALGIMDPHGTRRYAAQYISVSKQIYPFDFTMGFGNGRFGKRPLSAQTGNLKLEIITDPRGWLEDSLFFGGIQFAPSEKYALMLEYSPIKYHVQTDPAREKYFTSPAPSKYNFGLRYKPSKWSEVGMSWQRGNQFGVNASVAFDIGVPLVPLYDRSYQEGPSEKTDPELTRIARAMSGSGFSDVGVTVGDDELRITAHNDKYFLNSRAVGKVLRIIADINPAYAGRVHIILTERGIPVMEFECAGRDIAELYADRMSLDDFLAVSEFRTVVTGAPETRVGRKASWSYGVRPALETFLNDPSGFFKYRLGVQGWINYQPLKGLSLITGLVTYPLNNISTVNEPVSDPVRSDIVLYKEKSVVLNRLMFDWIKRVTPDVYGRLAAGHLEVQYSGVDAEVATPAFDGRVYFGASGSAVKKRDPDNILKFKRDGVRDLYTTAFFNTRLNVPETGMAVDVKAGRFLAGDYGARVTLSKFINGVTIRAWYGITDTSGFEDGFNRGYHDKGIGVSIPLRLFKGTDSRTAYNYSLSPWTRDTGQDIEHFETLFDFIGRNAKVFLDREKTMLF